MCFVGAEGFGPLFLWHPRGRILICVVGRTSVEAKRGKRTVEERRRQCPHQRANFVHITKYLLGSFPSSDTRKTNRDVEFCCSSSCANIWSMTLRRASDRAEAGTSADPSSQSQRDSTWRVQNPELTECSVLEGRQLALAAAKRSEGRCGRTGFARPRPTWTYASGAPPIASASCSKMEIQSLVVEEED